MEQKIIQVGNSAAVVIPKQLLTEAGLDVGNKVVVEKDPNGLTIAISRKGATFASSITPEFIAIIERINKKYGPALKKLAHKNL